MAGAYVRDLVPTAMLEEGRRIHLEILHARPDGAGPFPVVVFNHGSTGDGSRPALFGQSRVNPSITKFFLERGWMVAYPQRRGRGRSGGLYDEGFKPDRSGYSGHPAVALAGLDRAIEDVDAALAWVRARNDVDRDRILVAGASRGGILAIAYAGRQPQGVCGAVNFNGGWLGRRMATYPEVNRAGFLRGAAFPGDTLWVHGSYDQYYPIAHCRGNFEAFVAQGGRGTFHALRGGHGLVEQPALWSAAVERFLNGIRA